METEQTGKTANPISAREKRQATVANAMRLTPPPSTFAGAAARSLSAAALAALLSVSSITPSVPPAFGPAAAQAKELASGSGSRVNKDPISLLRLALPRVSKEARELQAGLEECQDNLARLNGQVASSALQKAKVAAGKSGAMLKSVPPAKAAEAQAALDTINAAMDEVGAKIAASRQGEALAATERALGAVTQLQEAMASGYAQPSPPKEFASLPYLKGRATVDLVLQPGKRRRPARRRPSFRDVCDV